MSSTIDERVVSMQFDNTQFEQNVQTSLGTLDKLKAALNFDNASKSLEAIDDAVKYNNIYGLGNAVEAVGSKFSALEVVAITAISNITNSIVNKLKAAIDSATVKPLMDGFKEYETQLDSVQTIMANTGKSVGEVNASLDVMNTYADKTIYNFQEMAANLGRFTAAGTKLETSQQAIMGISNLAAVSGSNSQKASVAMDQLSQAIAAGSLKLQDWNSVVNAGMGGKVFQDALQRTAQHMLDANVQVKDASGNMISYKDAIGGTTTSIKELIAGEGSFRESLKNGWITTDVLTETLRQFQLNVETTEDYQKTVKELVEAGYTEKQAKQIADMARTAMDAATKVKTFSQLIDTTKEALGSGWTKTWQIIFGDFEEAKELWTGVSNILNDFIDKTSDARNELLQSWKDLGGRTELIEAFSNTFSGLQNVLWPIKEAFEDVFKPLTGETLFAATKRLRELAEGIHLNDDAAQKLYDVFHGIFSFVGAVGNVFGRFGKIVGPLFEVFKAFFEIFMDIASHVGRAVTGFSEAADSSDMLGKAIDFVCDILLKFAGFVRNAWSKLKEFYGLARSAFDTPGIKNVTESLKSVGGIILSVKDSAVNAVRSIKDSFGKSTILEKLKTIWDTLKQFAGGVFSGIVNTIKQIVDALSAGDGKGFSNILKVLTTGGIIMAIKNILDLKDALSIFDSAKGIVENISEIFSGLKDTLKSFQENVKAGALLKIAAAVGILALSILVISSIKPEKLNTGLKGITAAFAELILAMQSISKITADPAKLSAIGLSMILVSVAVLILASAVKSLAKLKVEDAIKGIAGVGILLKMISQFLNGTYFGDDHVVKNALGMIFIAAALKILVSACEKIGQIPFNKLVKGLIGVGALLKEVSLFLSNTKFGPKAISNAIGMVIMAAAIRLLGNSVEFFGNLEWGVIGKGLTAIGLLLLELAAFTNLSGNAKHVFTTGLSLIFIAAAMNILAKAMSSFGNMEWDQIGKSLTAMGGALLEMSIALNLVPKGAIAKALSLVIVGASLLIVANVFEKFGEMNWEQIGKSIAAMGYALLEMTLALSLMQGGIGGAAALVIVAAALAIITPILIALGNLEWEQIGKGLIALAGALLIFGLAGALLGPVAIGLAALGGAIIVVSASFAIFGASLLVIAAGIMALSKAGEAIPAMISTLGSFLAGVAEGIATTFGVFIEKALETLVGALPKICAAVIQIVSYVLITLQATIPMVLSFILNTLTNVIQTLANHAPAILQAIINLFVSIVGVISQNIPVIVSSIVGVLTSILQAIADNVPKIISSVAGIIVAVLQSIRDAIPQIVGAFAEVIVAFLTAVSDHIPDVINAAFELVISFIDGLASAIEGNSEKLASSVSHLISAIITAATKLLGGAASTFLHHGGELISSLINGIKEKAPGIAEKVKEALGKAIEFISSHAPEWLSKGIELIGKLVEGIATNAPKVLEKVKEGITNAGNFVKEKAPEWLSAGKDLVQGLIDGAGEKIGEVGTKAKEIGKKALDSIKNFLGIKSPSTAFKEVGNNVGQGLIDGVDEKGGEVESSSQGLGGKLLSGITDALSSLGDKVSSIFGNTKDTVESEGSEIAEAGADSMAQFAAGVDSGMSAVGPAVEKGLAEMPSAINSMNSKWQSEGKKLSESLGTGIKRGNSKVRSAGKDVAKKGAEGAKSTKDKWRDVGKALADGLAKGVRDHSSKISDAAKSAAEKAYKAAKAKLGVKSPSKVFAELGKFIDLGLAKGIIDNTDSIVTNTNAMAERIISTAERALAPVADLMNSDIIDDPVIKPVLDLSDIQNGSNRLYSMMSDMDRYSLHGNVELATNTAFSVGRERQSSRDRDDDVLSALIDGLKALKEQNETPRGNTYIIDGITYDDGSNVASAINMLVRAAKVGGRA